MSIAYTNELQEYLEAHSSAEPTLLYNVWREANIHLLQPRMLSGHLQGRLLKLLVMLSRPRNVLEVGTYSGYATLCLAEGVSELRNSNKCTVHTIEVEEELEPYIRPIFESSPYSEYIQLHMGRAEEIIPRLMQRYPFDFVYIDANKRDYSNYYNSIMEYLPSGALLLADNTLWDGKVLNTEQHKDAQTKAIDAFNKQIAQDPRVEKVMLPLRDGLTLIYKK